MKHVNIQKIHSEFLPKYYNFVDEVSQEIATNELFKPNLIYKSSHLEEVSGAVKKLMTVSISYPVSGDFRPSRKVSRSRTPTKDSTCIYTDAFSRTSLLMMKNSSNSRHSHSRHSGVSPRRSELWPKRDSIMPSSQRNDSRSSSK